MLKRIGVSALRSNDRLKSVSSPSPVDICGRMALPKTIMKASLLAMNSFTVFFLLFTRGQADVDTRSYGLGGTCYYPSGDIAYGYYPCIVVNAYISACCQTGWTCFSNSLCVMTDPTSSSNLNVAIGSTSRAACTDPEWSSEVCGGFCLRKTSVSSEMVTFADF